MPEWPWHVQPLVRLQPTRFASQPSTEGKAVTKQAAKILQWSVPVLATLTALLAVEELRQVPGVVQVVSLLLAVATAVVAYLTTLVHPGQEAPQPQPPTPVKTK